MYELRRGTPTEVKPIRCISPDQLKWKGQPPARLGHAIGERPASDGLGVDEDAGENGGLGPAVDPGVVRAALDHHVAGFERKSGLLGRITLTRNCRSFFRQFAKNDHAEDLILRHLVGAARPHFAATGHDKDAVGHIEHVVDVVADH